MARIRNEIRATHPSRVLVVSLLVQDPTAVQRQKTTAEPTAEGAATRARRRRASAAALPEEILVWEILVRLPPNDILRCRAVCRHWRDLTSGPDFLLAHHRRQPSLLLLTHYGTASKSKIIITDTRRYRTKRTLSIEPRFQRGHRVLGLEDHEGFNIHASCDGLLLLSFSDGRFGICNTATRQCAPLQCLTAAGRSINTAALYLHQPSGEYRVLYWRRTSHQEEVVYYIFKVRRGSSPRCIAGPSDTPHIGKAMMTCNKAAPPVAFCDCLHWEPDCSDSGFLVFNTVDESFRLMRRPADATRLCTRLCDMESSIGFSCFGDGSTAVKIWVLEDYTREIWSFKYQIEIPVWISRNLDDAQHLLLSNKGDMLLYGRSYGRDMFHCDNTGKVIEQFQCDPWSRRFIGPWFKESLVKHDFFRRKGSNIPRHSAQLRIFERL